MSDDQVTSHSATRSLRPLCALLPFIYSHLGMLVLALSALFVAGAAMLALPVALRFVIDRGFASQDAQLIDRYFLGLLSVSILLGIFGGLRFYLITWLGERVMADIRDAVYRHIVRMDAAFFEVTKVGEVLSRLTTDTTLIQSIASVGISITLRSLLTLVGSLAMLTLTSPRLTAMIGVLVPVVIVPLILLGRHVRRLSRASQDRLAESSGLAGETLSAIQTVQAFTLEALQCDLFTDSVHETFTTGVRRIRARALLTSVTVVALFTAVTLLLWLGAHAVLNNEMTPGELGQFLFYTMFVAGAAASLCEMWGEVQRAAGAMERLTELLSAKPEIVPPKHPVPLANPTVGGISFKTVTFWYPSRPKTPALRRFSLDVSPGETVALVGPSGAGKSTTFQLLLRFYDPQSGGIEIDGVDISRADPKQVRACIGLVPQETFIFGTTARENIRYGRPGAGNHEVEAAARAAAADAFIEELPEGYDTFLGDRGTRLSGGQRQRIAIARAVLKNPAILLLDEATSSLDAESERLVQEALQQLMEDRTTLIIAHRLATILNADRIVVMDGGRIIDTGTHEELVVRNPLYARLAELQFGAARGCTPANQARTIEIPSPH